MVIQDLMPEAARCMREVGRVGSLRLPSSWVGPVSFPRTYTWGQIRGVRRRFISETAAWPKQPAAAFGGVSPWLRHAVTNSKSGILARIGGSCPNNLEIRQVIFTHRRWKIYNIFMCLDDSLVVRPSQEDICMFRLILVNFNTFAHADSRRFILPVAYQNNFGCKLIDVSWRIIC